MQGNKSRPRHDHVLAIGAPVWLVIPTGAVGTVAQLGQHRFSMRLVLLAHARPGKQPENSIAASAGNLEILWACTRSLLGLRGIPDFSPGPCLCSGFTISFVYCSANTSARLVSSMPIASAMVARSTMSGGIKRTVLTPQLSNSNPF
jgi:hypothetical protein